MLDAQEVVGAEAELHLVSRVAAPICPRPAKMPSR